MPFGSRTPGARGVTLIELVVVVTIMASMALMATGLFPGVIQYFRARRSMENLMWDLRKVQQRARSRGNTRGAAFGGLFGVMFYAGSTNPDGTVAIPPVGFSYLPFGPADAPPLPALGALTPTERSRVVNLDPSLIPVAAGAVDAPPAVHVRIQFEPDSSQGRADIVPDAVHPMTLPNNFLDFRLHDNEGYFRIQFEGQRFIGLRWIKL